MGGQLDGAIAIGGGAGTGGQTGACIAIGSGAGSGGQTGNSIAIGSGAGTGRQDVFSIAIGANSASGGQTGSAIAIGANAGMGGQNIGAIAIGQGTGTNQGIGSIAIGVGAGSINQLESSIAIGSSAAINQGTQSVALGENAAMYSSSNQSVSIGYRAGFTGQSDGAIAIGQGAGNENQGTGAIAIGFNAGKTGQGDNAIAIGNLAGEGSGITNQAPKTIILNATGTVVNGVTGQTGSFYVAPVRSDDTQTLGLAYNSSTYEIVTSTAVAAGGLGAGNTLTVDAVYGNDTLGAASPYSAPFLTITAALAAASSGQQVFVRAGTYNEYIDIPAGVAVRGASTQTVKIQKLAVVASTTLITLNNQSRIEDVTLNLTSSANVNLVGVSFVSTLDVIDGKFRSAVLNVTSTASGGGNVYGVQSSSTSTTSASFSSSSAVRACTINVTASGTGAVRGIIVDGPNRFNIRDTIVYVSGAATNLRGVETSSATNQGSYAELKTSTIYGLSTVGPTGYDITRTAGTIVLNATDLVNANANGGFSVKTEPSNIFYGVVDNLNDGTHYLLPGTIPHNSLPTSLCGILFSQKVIVFELICSAGNALTGADQAIFNLYKNTDVATTPFATATLNSSNQVVRVTGFSQTFDSTDKIVCRLVTSGGVGGNPLSVTVSIY